LSKQTLEIFIDAFGVLTKDAESLWRQWRGQEEGQVVVGSLASPESMPNYRTREYDILMLHEHHWLGANGLPACHRTQVNIRSRIEGLRIYQYRFDTDLARVHVPRNHGAEIGPVYQMTDEIYAVDFRFNRPLGIGEQDYLELYARRPLVCASTVEVGGESGGWLYMGMVTGRHFNGEFYMCLPWLRAIRCSVLGFAQQ